jgi:hypothetical protein
VVEVDNGRRYVKFKSVISGPAQFACNILLFIYSFRYLLDRKPIIFTYAYDVVVAS